METDIEGCVTDESTHDMAEPDMWQSAFGDSSAWAMNLSKLSPASALYPSDPAE